MAKRKKPETDETPAPKPAPKMATSLAGMLKSVSLEKPVPKAKPAPPPPPAPPPTKIAVTPVAVTARPSDGLRGGDRSIYFEAMNGVRRLNEAKKERTGRVVATPPPKNDAAATERDEEARARLRALVGGGSKFDVREDDDYVEASAAGTPESVMRQLLRATPGPGLPSIDLHGAKEHEVEARVSRFVRGEHKKGAKRVLVIHGKGLHSSPAGGGAEGPRGRSILGRATVAALTTGGAAPLVRAFVSAPTTLGGTGALLVELA